MQSNKAKKVATAISAVAISLPITIGVASSAVSAPFPTAVTCRAIADTPWINSRAGFANIRDGAGTNFRIRGTLNTGVQVTRAEVCGSWSRITNPTTGWISNSLLSTTQPGTTTPTPPTTPATGWFRAQIGAFRTRAGADARAAEARRAGLETYIRRVGNIYRVQVGAFRTRADAQDRVNHARNLGFRDAFVQTN